VIHLKDGDVVPTLIATKKESPGGVKVEAGRIAPSCPFFPNKYQSAVWAYGKYPDAVVQPVAGIDKPAIR
jgi:hypothetical protein